MIRGLVACILALLLVGCVGGGVPHVAPPEVRLAGLGFGRLTPPEQELRLDLRVSNPNGFAIGVDSMTFDLEVDDIQFAHGRTEREFELAALGETVVPVTLSVPTADLLERVAALGVEQRLDYRLSGEADLDNRLAGKVPFQYQGKLALPRMPGLGVPGS